MNVIELFAGAGGLALGLERAGFSCLMLNELDKNSCRTLHLNRPQWNVVEGDIKEIDFSPYEGKAHVVAGGFPCQSFSSLGNRLGMEDMRGTQFYEFSRAIDKIKPLICLGENVRGLQNHDNGQTLKTMVSTLNHIGYHVVPPKILNSLNYNVPQKRERLVIVGIRFCVLI